MDEPLPSVDALEPPLDAPVPPLEPELEPLELPPSKRCKSNMNSDMRQLHLLKNLTQLYRLTGYFDNIHGGKIFIKPAGD